MYDETKRLMQCQFNETTKAIANHIFLLFPVEHYYLIIISQATPYNKKCRIRLEKILGFEKQALNFRLLDPWKNQHHYTFIYISYPTLLRKQQKNINKKKNGETKKNN